MRYLTLFLTAMSLSAAVVDHPELQQVYPWETADIVARAYYGNTGIPAPGIWMNMIIMDDESSGYHSHGSEASPRPTQTPIAAYTLLPGESATRRQTNSSGIAVFRFRGNNFSGKVTVLIVPEDIRINTQQHHVYLGYFDLVRHGNTVQKVYLRSLPAYGDLADFTRHDDTRHLDAAGLIGNSRYATINALANIELMAHYFRTRGPGGHKLDIPRISLRDGGCADNKMLAGAGTVYQYPVWQRKACNSLGIAFDIENPSIAAGGVGTPTGDAAYGVFDQVAENLLRCKFSKLMDDGITLVPTATSAVPAEGGGFLLVNDYWRHQPIISLICSGAPGPTAN